MTTIATVAAAVTRRQTSVNGSAAAAAGPGGETGIPVAVRLALPGQYPASRQPIRI